MAVYLAARPILRAIAVPGGELLVALAVVVPILVTVAVARVLRMPPLISYAASLVALVVVVLGACGLHGGAVISAMAHVPTRLVTETLPITAGRSVLIPAVVLIWVAAAVVAELLVREPVSGGGGAAAALAVPVVLYLVSYAVAARAPGRDSISGAALLACLALLAVLRTSAAAGRAFSRPGGPADEGPPLAWRPLVCGVIAVALAAAGAGYVSARAAGSGPAAAVQRSVPVTTPDFGDPVDVMASLRNPGAVPSPGATQFKWASNRRSDGYLSLAVLDDYDGGEWVFQSHFSPTGGRVPGQPGEETSPVRQVVTSVTSIPVPLLPALDRPIEVTGPAVGADQSTGMLLPASIRAGSSWEVTSYSPTASLGALPAADGIDIEAGAGDAAIPAGTSADLATLVRFLSGLTGTHPAPTVSFLQQVLTSMRSDERRITPAGDGSAVAAAGTSLAAVINSITVDRAATPEQFATAFAMVARDLGVPARLVTGYRLTHSSAGPGLPAGSYRITGADVWTWVEIPVSGVGWVVADATPDATTASAAPPPEAVQAPSTTLPPRPAAAVPAGQIPGAHALAPPVRPHLARQNSRPLWELFLAGLLALAVLVLLAGPAQAAARRAWRRSRRRSEGPRLMAAGAWLELMEGMARAGLHLEPGATNSEVASEVGAHFGSDLAVATAALAATADRALFSLSPFPPEEARRAWDGQLEVLSALRATLDRRGRLRALLTVGRPAGQPR